ncbi:MAG: hypothetical protein ACJ788_11860 [Ktedonobacteraceae bacterium]
MSDIPNKSLKAPRYPTEMELAAYNEAGHAIAGIVQGRWIGRILIRQEEESWEGKTGQDIDWCAGMLPNVPPRALYTRIDYPYPQGNRRFINAEICILKFAGVVAEELLCEQRGVNTDQVRIGKNDVIEAEGLARGQFPDDPQKQQEMLHNTKSLARKILSDPACWHTVEVLARAVMDENVKEPVMNGERAHEIIDQAFAQDLTLKDDTLVP